MSVGRKLARNFLALFAGNVVGQIFNLLALLLLARALTPAAFGTWNVASAWMLYFLRAGEIGLEVIGLRNSARRPEETSHWLARVVIIRLLLAMLLFAVVLSLFLGDILPEETAWLIVMFAVLLFPAALTAEWVFEARQEIGGVSIVRMAKGAIFFLLVALFVVSNNDLSAAVWFYLLGTGIPTVALFIIAVRKAGFDPTSFSTATAVETLKESFPVGLASILSTYCIFAATLIGGYMLESSELGLFTAAHRPVVFLWAYVIVTMHRVLIPTLTNYYHENKNSYVGFIRRFFSLSVVASLPLGLVGTFAASRIIGILYPQEYSAASRVFEILLWAFVFAIARSIFEIAMISSGNQRRYSIGVAAVAIAYSFITPLCIHQWGIVGAAWATLIVEGGYFLGLLVIFPDIHAGSLLRQIVKPVALCMTVGALLVLFPEEYRLWLLPFALALFVAGLVVSKSITQQDLALVKSLFGMKSSLAP